MDKEETVGTFSLLFAFTLHLKLGVFPTQLEVFVPGSPWIYNCLGRSLAAARMSFRALGAPASALAAP